jgi:hypothetical protein
VILVDGQWIELILSYDRNRLEQVRRHLQRDFEKGRYNAERALELYARAVDAAVWDVLRELPLAKPVYNEYRHSGARSRLIHRLVSQFQAETGARDQRPARQWLRFAFGA